MKANHLLARPENSTERLRYDSIQTLGHGECKQQPPHFQDATLTGIPDFILTGPLTAQPRSAVQPSRPAGCLQ